MLIAVSVFLIWRNYCIARVPDCAKFLTKNNERTCGKQLVRHFHASFFVWEAITSAFIYVDDIANDLQEGRKWCTSKASRYSETRPKETTLFWVIENYETVDINHYRYAELRDKYKSGSLLSDINEVHCWFKSLVQILTEYPNYMELFPHKQSQDNSSSPHLSGTVSVIHWFF